MTKGDLKNLERDIGEGHKPPCPVCGSELHIGRKTKGVSGGWAHSFSCSNEDCDLTAGLARVPWHAVIRKALANRTIALSIAALGSVTLASIAGFGSGFVKWKGHENTAARFKGIVPAYIVESSTLLLDLTTRVQGAPKESPSKVVMNRFDKLVANPNSVDDFRIVFGTNGLPLDVKSISHPLTAKVEEVGKGLFGLSLRHTYRLTIPRSAFSPGQPVPSQLRYVYQNGFQDETEEWTGTRPSYPTKRLNFVVIFPRDKPCKRVRVLKKAEGEEPIELELEHPLVSEDGRILYWSRDNPEPGFAYLINFEW